MTPEFARPERIDAIGETARTVAIEADPTERRRLAGRFGLVAIDQLHASFAVRRAGAAILAEGRVEASVTQACSVTGEPLTQAIDEAVVLRFVEEGAGHDEVELASDDLDTLPVEDGAIDLGEAAAETVALALDPFPRSSAAAAALVAAGVIDEEEAARKGGAFGALASLRDTLT